MFLWFSAAAVAAPLQVGVTGVDDARAIHLLFGDAGDVSTSCLPTSKGWACDSVDVERPSPLGVVVDTRLIPADSIDESGPYLTINYDQGAFDLDWARTVPSVDGVAPGLLLVQVNNANANQAPMLRVELDGTQIEMGCADDGSFPDTVPNDGVFFCVHILSPSILRSESWTASFSIRDAEGEDVNLGSLAYSNGSGIRFATLEIGDASQTSSDAFSLATRPWEPEVEANEIIVEGVEKEGGIQPVESEPPKPPQSPEVVAPPQPIPQWVWLGVIFGAGCMVGRKFGRSGTQAVPVLDAARPLEMAAFKGGGPCPDGDPIQVLATDPLYTAQTVIQELTVLRRLVVVGHADLESLRMGHDILEVTDPDRHAVVDLLRTLCSDGGLPPLLIVMGRQSVLDTGGASPTPAEDLIAVATSLCWAVLIESEDASPTEGRAVWGHDAQAGWSVR